MEVLLINSNIKSSLDARCRREGNVHLMFGYRTRSVPLSVALPHCSGLQGNSSSAIVRFPAAVHGLAPAPNNALKSLVSLAGTAFRGPLA
jgi:hypothetical protein